MPIGPFKDFADCVGAQKRKGKSDESARKICGALEKVSKKNKELKFFPSNIVLKEIEKTFFSEGFIATTHPDRAADESTGIKGDILSEKVIDKIVNVLNNPSKEGHPEATQVSYRHDWILEDNADLPPAGINISAEKKQTDDGHWGVYVTTEHAKTFPEKEKLIYDIDKKIIPGYSIEYNSTNDEIIDYNGDSYRFIDDIEFSGYGFANGRKIANPQAEITATGYKEMVASFKQKKSKINKGVEKMKENKEEETSEKPKDEEDKPEEKPDGEDPAEEKPKEEKKEEPAKEEEKAEEKESKSLKKEVKESVLKEQIKKEVLQEMKEGKPMINNQKTEIKEIKEYTDAVIGKEIDGKIKKASMEQQWKEAAKLHNFLDSKGGISYTSSPNSTGLSFEIKENKLELKDLETDTNYAGAQTAFVSILTAYEQYPAELNAIYQPVVINQLNDVTSVWNVLPKDDFSTASVINFRVRDGRNTTAGGYTEATARTFITLGNFSGNVGRTKYNLHFSYYRVLVSVTGPMIALANSVGGLGDVFSMEVRDSTVDLMQVLEAGLVGAGDGTAEDASLGFEKLIITSGNLYGKDVTSKTLLAAAGVDVMSSAAITLKKMREMIDGSRANGARVEDLSFFCHFTQERFIKALIQDMQRIVPTSARVGFTGNIEFDGVPVFASQNLNTDDLFLVDIVHTRIAIKVAPTLEMFGKNADAVTGQIKTYWNLYSTRPNLNYWINGLATS